MAKRKVEVFTSGCPLCEPVVELVNKVACPSCEVIIYDLNKGSNDNIGREKAKEYGVSRVPSVAVDAKLLECCKIGTVSEQALRDAGVGQP
jgi:hypothetical protein